jgi:hypothetical protein
MVVNAGGGGNNGAMMAMAYYLDGGPMHGEIRYIETDSLEVVAPRWQAPGTASVATATIPVAHGWYRHNGHDRLFRDDGQSLPVMRWGGFDK